MRGVRIWVGALKSLKGSIVQRILNDYFPSLPRIKQ